jgi:hypothetical protein
LTDKEVKDTVWSVFSGKEEGLVAYYSFNHPKENAGTDSAGLITLLS